MCEYSDIRLLAAGGDILLAGDKSIPKQRSRYTLHYI